MSARGAGSRDIACTRPVQRGYPFVWLRSLDGGAVDGVLDGTLHALPKTQ